MPKSRLHYGKYVSERRWPDPRAGAFVVEADWDVVGGRLGVVSILIRPHGSTPSRLLSATDLRRLRFGELARSHATLLEGVLAGLDGDGEWDDVVAADIRSELKQLRQRRSEKPGRPAQYDREHYEHVARIYTAAMRAARSPTKAVADKMGVSSSTAGRWVHTARHKYNLLPETTSGKPRGPAVEGGS